MLLLAIATGLPRQTVELFPQIMTSAKSAKSWREILVSCLSLKPDQTALLDKVKLSSSIDPLSDGHLSSHDSHSRPRSRSQGGCFPRAPGSRRRSDGWLTERSTCRRIPPRIENYAYLLRDEGRLTEAEQYESRGKALPPVRKRDQLLHIGARKRMHFPGWCKRRQMDGWRSNAPGR
jgi:hypothetical protein